MTKVLFLDIDGVVNCAHTRERHRGFIGIDPYMALLVGSMIDRTGVTVVLSSSWRHFEGGVDEVNKQVWKIMDVTPTITATPENTKVGTSSHVPRGYEIKAWLDKHPEVTKYAIVDDDSDMLEEQLPNFFKTTWQTGITPEIIAKIEEHLK